MERQGWKRRNFRDYSGSCGATDKEVKKCIALEGQNDVKNLRNKSLKNSLTSPLSQRELREL